MKQLYAITDPALMPGELLIEKVEACLAGGCRYVQYRNKTGSDAERQRDATALTALCHQFDAFLIINDDIELAQRTSAGGVHLGQDDEALAIARSKLGTAAIIGITCHDSLKLAIDAADQGANYVAFGRFFPSTTKAMAPPADLKLLRQARQALKLPVVAIGGINIDNAAQVVAAGADCLAVCHDIFAPADLGIIEQRAKAYGQLFTECITD